MSEESKIAWDLWKNSQKQKREVMCSKYRSLHFAEKFSNENKYFRKHMIDFFSINIKTWHRISAVFG